MIVSLGDMRKTTLCNEKKTNIKVTKLEIQNSGLERYEKCSVATVFSFTQRRCIIEEHPLYDGEGAVSITSIANWDGLYCGFGTIVVEGLFFLDSGSPNKVDYMDTHLCSAYSHTSVCFLDIHLVYQCQSTAPAICK